jgi:hypothetical protein
MEISGSLSLGESESINAETRGTTEQTIDEVGWIAAEQLAERRLGLKWRVLTGCRDNGSSLQVYNFIAATDGTMRVGW